jgi:HK97 family phage prohead protease
MGKEILKIENRERYFKGYINIRQKPDGADEESRTIEGYAIVFNEESAPLYEDEREVIREVIAPDAITKALLDSSDILMTLFHDREQLLARSKAGEGTLKYSIDERGVKFEFDAPHTADGDKAYELVNLRVIDGCSFAFRTKYWDDDYVSCKSETRDGKIQTVYTVNRIDSLHDFTLTTCPAYPATECDTRDVFNRFRQQEIADHAEAQRQLAEMRAAQNEKIY